MIVAFTPKVAAGKSIKRPAALRTYDRALLCSVCFLDIESGEEHYTSVTARGEPDVFKIHKGCIDEVHEPSR